jgi:hypothetical protein
MSAATLERFLTDPLAYAHRSWFPATLTLPTLPWSATVQRLVNAWLVSTYCLTPVQASAVPASMTWVSQPADVLADAALALGLRIRKREYLQVIDRARLRCLEQSVGWRQEAATVEGLTADVFKVERTPLDAWQDASALREYVRATGICAMLHACNERADLHERLRLKFSRSVQLPAFSYLLQLNSLQEIICDLIQGRPTTADGE